MASLAVAETDEYMDDVSAMLRSPSVASPAEDQGGFLSSSFVDDVTIPDGMVVAPGQKFVKTWRVVNDGDVSFPPATALRHYGDARLGGDEKGLEVGTKEPGEVFDVSVPLVAPDSPRGRYMVRVGVGVWVWGWV